MESKKEIARLRASKWYYDNLEKAKEAKRAWYLRNKRSVPYEKINREDVYLKDGMICGICGGCLEMSDFTIDHIIPISKGGGHVFGNVHSAHRICNIRRGTKPLEILYSI